MVPEERSPIADGRTQLARRSRPGLPGWRRVPGANKRSVLGTLVLVVGVAAATTLEGLVVGVPLLVAGWCLAVAPRFGSTCTR